MRKNKVIETLNHFPDEFRIEEFVEKLLLIEKEIQNSERQNFGAIQKREQKVGQDFVDKWAGFLDGQDIDASKFDYLSEKYK